MASGRLIIGIVALLSASGTAAAQTAVRVAHDAITHGDLTHAETVLVAEQRVFPRNAEVLVNLAAVYASTGREREATALYQRVLASENVLLDRTADQSVSSHRIARIGLQRLGRIQTAAR